MRGASLLPLVGLSAFFGAEAINLQRKDVPSVVNFGIQRQKIPATSVTRDRRRRKRSKTVTGTLDNEITLYSLNVSVGTPAQDITLALDTGSSDLWVNAANSTFCAEKSNDCAASGTYDAASSSSYGFVSSDFSITYEDGTGASGDYVTDTVRVGGDSLTKFQFGVGYKSSSSVGTMGIGYELDEADASSGSTYVNLPEAMVSDGLINSAAYSLWLDDLDASTGQILFGGVNTAKYTGDLKTVPILQVDGEYAEFLIALTGMSLTSSSNSTSYGSSTLPVAALLDSGTSLMYLPDSIVASIYNDIGVTYDNQEGTGYVPCSLAKEDYNFTFTFSDPVISVPMSEVVLSQESDLTLGDGTAACVFGIEPYGDDSTAVLGDTFLRSAYVVYDIASNEISLANTDFNSDDDVVEIGTGSAAVPGATLVANAVTSVSAAPTGTNVFGTAAVTIGSGTITSAGRAPIQTAQPGHLLASIAGAGLLLAL